RLVDHSSLSRQPQQSASISREILLSLFGGDLQSPYSIDRPADQPSPLLRIKWSIRSKQAGRGAKEGMTASRRRDLAIESRIGVEHLKILDRPTLETIFLCQGIIVWRAEEYLPKSKVDLPGEIRNHATHMMSYDLHIRQLVKQARE